MMYLHTVLCLWAICGIRPFPAAHFHHVGSLPSSPPQDRCGPPAASACNHPPHHRCVLLNAAHSLPHHPTMRSASRLSRSRSGTATLLLGGGCTAGERGPGAATGWRVLPLLPLPLLTLFPLLGWASATAWGPPPPPLRVPPLFSLQEVWVTELMCSGVRAGCGGPPCLSSGAEDLAPEPAGWRRPSPPGGISAKGASSDCVSCERSADAASITPMSHCPTRPSWCGGRVTA